MILQWKTSILLLSLMLAASRGLAQGSYLVAEIGLMRTDRGDMYSAADADCFTYFGNPSQNCVFVGSHTISDTVSSENIAGGPYESVASYDGAVHGTPVGGNCYRARITGSIVHESFSQAWGSSQVCAPDPADKPPKTDCPVILDLDGHGFHLTGLDDAVRFDLDADGVAEELGWTAPGWRNGFLCMDRNHDGRIEDGRELFGQVTPLANGQPAQIGYIALAQLDLPAFGGNGDGVIGPEDAGFKDLCVWVDANHDGVSQPGEILTLEQAGVVRLAFDYVESRKQDQFGNLFRYKSKAWLRNPAGQVRENSTYDVFFVHR